MRESNASLIFLHLRVVEFLLVSWIMLALYLLQPELIYAHISTYVQAKWWFTVVNLHQSDSVWLPLTSTLQPTQRRQFKAASGPVSASFIISLRLLQPLFG